MTRIKIRKDLVEEGVEYIPTYEPNELLSATQIEQAELVSCDDDGVVTIKLKTGKTCMVDSIDLDYESSHTFTNNED